MTTEKLIYVARCSCGWFGLMSECVPCGAGQDQLSCPTCGEDDVDLRECRRDVPVHTGAVDGRAAFPRKITDLALTNLPRLMELVGRENVHQLARWGAPSHVPAEWLMYLTEGVGALARAVFERERRGGTDADVVRGATRVATLALKVMEMYLDSMGTRLGIRRL
jgi:hypothetical protein